MIMYDHQICAEALYETGVGRESVKAAKNLFEESSELKEFFSSPVFTKNEKFAVVKKLFSSELHSFLCVMIETGNISRITEIFEAYEQIDLDRKNVIRAKLFYVTKPNDDTLESFGKTLKKKYSANDVILDIVEDKSLVGGYKLQVGDTVFDKSISGSLRAFRNKIVGGA